jgi:hypothetical protein
VATKGAGHVRIVGDGARFALLRDGSPYYVRGVGGTSHLDVAERAGANSVRTWGGDEAGAAFAAATTHGMTVLLGVWLDHDAALYESGPYREQKRHELQALLGEYRNDPALLMWAIGNELNLSANTPAAWSFVAELVQMIHARDPNHPVMTVIAGSQVEVVDNVVRHAPGIDALGINHYGGLENADAEIARSQFRGPYLVTEWGPQGHWEVAKTAWGRPIEPTSDAKAADYARRYAYIAAHGERILGSYVFLWGQKEERTPTWYGMFAEERPELGLHGEAYAAVDAMFHAWRGAWPANRAPALREVRLAERRAADGIIVRPSEQVVAVADALDPDGDGLSFAWETLAEATELGEGGAKEPRPLTVGAPVRGDSPSVSFVAPAKRGEYRLYAYALDGHGHVATGNVPFRVE